MRLVNRNTADHVLVTKQKYFKSKRGEFFLLVVV